jgi:hypothetical protein
MGSYKIGQVIKFNGGRAKITAVNPDGTATLNWDKAPTGQVKGSFAGTLPAVKKDLAFPDFNDVFEDVNPQEVEDISLALAVIESKIRNIDNDDEKEPYLREKRNLESHLDSLMGGMITVESPICSVCDAITVLEVSEDAYTKWKNKELLIQDAFPDWSPDKREILKSGIHPNCWKHIFDN